MPFLSTKKKVLFKKENKYRIKTPIHKHGIVNTGLKPCITNCRF